MTQVVMLNTQGGRPMSPPDKGEIGCRSRLVMPEKTTLAWASVDMNCLQVWSSCAKGPGSTGPVLLHLLLACSLAQAYSDVERILRAAMADHYQKTYNTFVKRSYLNDGFCFSVDEPSEGIVKCSEQPDSKLFCLREDENQNSTLLHQVHQVKTRQNLHVPVLRLYIRNLCSPI